MIAFGKLDDKNDALYTMFFIRWSPFFVYVAKWPTVFCLFSKTQKTGCKRLKYHLMGKKMFSFDFVLCCSTINLPISKLPFVWLKGIIQAKKPQEQTFLIKIISVLLKEFHVTKKVILNQKIV